MNKIVIKVSVSSKKVTFKSDAMTRGIFNYFLLEREAKPNSTDDDSSYDLKKYFYTTKSLQSIISHQISNLCPLYPFARYIPLPAISLCPLYPFARYIPLPAISLCPLYPFTMSVLNVLLTMSVFNVNYICLLYWSCMNEHNIRT